MPTYLTAVNGVQLSEALAEAAVYAPIHRAMLNTLELRHPTLAAPVRIVVNHENILATLEADAPADASTEVEFLAAYVESAILEESDNAATPEIQLTIGNVAGLMSEALRAAEDSLVPWEITERVYASDDLSAPHKLPVLTLELSSAEMLGSTLKVTASYGDHVNVAIPRLTFKSTEYPGLTAR